MKYTQLLALFFLCVASVCAQENDSRKNNDIPKNNEMPIGASIQLESTFIGDKEQPAVSYFIPWKGSETPDKLQWNMEQKHDQALQVVDRDVLLHSMNIYNDLKLENTALKD